MHSEDEIGDCAVVVVGTTNGERRRSGCAVEEEEGEEGEDHRWVGRKKEEGVENKKGDR